MLRCVDLDEMVDAATQIPFMLGGQNLVVKASQSRYLRN